MTDKTPPEDKVAMSNVASLAEAARKRTRKKKSASSGGETQDDDRPEIRIVNGEVPRVLDEADKALGGRDPTIYAQQARLVRIVAFDGDDTGEKFIHRQPGSITIQQVISAHLVDRLAYVARWKRYDSRVGDWIATDVPKKIADSFVARAGTWKHVPALTGVVEAPTLRMDGSVLDRPGYDAASGIYFAGKLPADYIAPPEKPTREQARQALDTIWDAVSDFPVVGPEDRASMIAGMLTALLRRSLPSAPMTCITAPMPGTGKSKVVDVMAVVATGRKATVMSLGKDDAEAEKRLHAALLSGSTIINLDNIDRPLYSDVLCQALTQETMKVRPLGASDEVMVSPNRSFFATGNNLDIRGDLKRRVVLVRLDAKMERPEQRKFARDVVDVVTERRGELITACLTIVRAYIAADCPTVDASPYGGFEGWDVWCRRPLIWLDIPDPLLSSEEVRAEDPDIALQRSLFAAWNRAFEQEAVTASDIAQRATEATRGGDGQSVYSNPDLHEAMLAACGEKITSKRFGYWLRRHQMRVCDGYRLERAGFDDHSKIAKWRLVSLTAAGNAGNGG